MDKVKDILDIPNYYNNFKNEIASENILHLLNSNPLEYMRELFIKNNKLFYNLRDELILRGFGFKQEYQNNYLLGRDYEIHSILIKSKDTDAFKKIDFAMLGASNFIERFNVQSDLFFHNVPWEGILHFLPNASSEYLKREFKKEGFSFTSIKKGEAIPFVHTNSYTVEEKGVSMIKESKVQNKSCDYNKLNLPLEHYYEGSLFQHFRNYCHKNNMKKFSDLTLDKVNEYEHVKFTRSETAKLVKEIYHEINKKYNPLPYDVDKSLNLLYKNRFKKMCKLINVNYLDILNDFYDSDNMYEDIFPVERIEKLVNYANDNIERILQEKKEKKKQEELTFLINEINNHPKLKYLLSSNIQDLSDIFSITIEDLPSGDLFLYEILNKDNTVYHSFLRKILKAMNTLVELKDMISNVSGILESREKKVIKQRESMTLQEIGDNLGITRERVRQIEGKANRQIKYYRNESKFELYFKFYTEHSKLVSMEGLCDAYHIDDPFDKVIIKKFLSETNAIHYIKSIDRYINKQDYNLIIEPLNKIDFSDPIIEIDKLKQIIPGEVINELQEVIDIMIKAKGYLRVNNIYVRKKINIKDRINYLFEHHITEPLHMNEEGYAYFIELMTNKFGVSYDSSKRSATARIAAGDNVILVDANTFFKHEDEKITESFLVQLEQTIDEILSTHPYADPRNIFDEERALVESASIYSPVHLYSIIQIYFEDKYESGYGNTLYIYKSNTDALDAESILLNYLKNNGHEVPFNKVLDDLNWKSFKLDQLMSRIDTVVTIKDKHIKTIESFQFTDEEINELIQIANQELQKGYLFTEDLAFDLAFNEKLKALVDRVILTDITTLSSIIKWLHKDVIGYPRMLYRSTSAIKSLEQVIAQEFPTLVSRADLLEFAGEKGYSEQKLATLAFNIVEDELFYPYTSTQFINANLISFDESVKNSLRDFLASKFANTPYQSVFSMFGYSQELAPISKYEWTEWLIYHFAEKVGYRKLTVNNQDYRYNKLLLVRVNSDLFTLEELVHYIVKTEYNGREHEEDLSKYLASKNVIYNPRRLSNDIYNSKYFKFDSFGFFQLR